MKTVIERKCKCNPKHNTIDLNHRSEYILKCTILEVIFHLIRNIAVIERIQTERDNPESSENESKAERRKKKSEKQNSICQKDYGPITRSGGCHSQ